MNRRNFFSGLAAVFCVGSVPSVPKGLSTEEKNANVVQSLYDKAVGGNLTAQIYWIKTRVGWSDDEWQKYSGHPYSERRLMQSVSRSWRDER